jgi:hypothetical protein
MPSGSSVSPLTSGSVYGGGPASAKNGSRTKGRHIRPVPSALHPYTPRTALAMRMVKGRHRHAPIRIPILQVEGDTGPPCKETQIIHPKDHRNLAQRHIRGSMPGLCCASLGFSTPSKRAYRTLCRSDDGTDRLSLLGSTFTLVWFVLTQIFVFNSTSTCRHSSPHLWWLSFGVLCVMYLMILEVIIVAILVFVVGPILFVRSKFPTLLPKFG